MRRIETAAMIVFLAGTSLGCDRRAELAGGPPAAAASGTPAGAPAPGSPAADPGGDGAVSSPVSPVARIVFLGKENACACTRSAIDASWNALQEALGGANIPIERYQVDTQGAQAAPYREMRALMGLPGIYFLNAAGGLIDVLQGEVSAGQIRAVLFPG
jgi:hypothetical protein